MNACSWFSQSAIPNRQCMWPHQKDHSMWKRKRKKKKKCFPCIARSWQSSIYRSMPEGLTLLQTSTFQLPPPFWYPGHIYASIQIKSMSEMMSYPGGLHSSGLSPLLFPEIVYCHVVWWPMDSDGRQSWNLQACYTHSKEKWFLPNNHTPFTYKYKQCILVEWFRLYNLNTTGQTKKDGYSDLILSRNKRLKKWNIY